MTEDEEKSDEYIKTTNLMNAVLKHFNINRIPLEDRKKAYKDYYESYHISNYLEQQGGFVPNLDNVNEAAEITDFSQLSEEDREYATDLGELYEMLKTRYAMQEWQFKIMADYGTVNGVVKSVLYNQEMFAAIIPDIHKNREIIKSEARTYGYYMFNYEELTDEDGMSWIIMILNPLKQSVYNDYLKNFKTIYHYAPVVCDDEIREHGLKASFSTGTATYDSKRIFFRIDKGGMSKGFKQMMSRIAFRNIRRNPTREFYEYPIKIKDVINHIKFFKDPNAGDACYCTVDIPYEYIRDEDKEIIKF